MRNTTPTRPCALIYLRTPPFDVCKLIAESATVNDALYYLCAYTKHRGYGWNPIMLPWLSKRPRDDDEMFTISVGDRYKVLCEGPGGRYTTGKVIMRWEDGGAVEYHVKRSLYDYYGSTVFNRRYHVIDMNTLKWLLYPHDSCYVSNCGCNLADTIAGGLIPGVELPTKCTDSAGYFFLVGEYLDT